MKNSNITFDALKSEMKAKKITQQQVSNHLQVENSHLWKTIRKETVSIHTFKKICEFLKLELYIVNPDEETETPLL